MNADLCDVCQRPLVGMRVDATTHPGCKAEKRRAGGWWADQAREAVAASESGYWEPDGLWGRLGGLRRPTGRRAALRGT